MIAVKSWRHRLVWRQGTRRRSTGYVYCWKAHQTSDRLLLLLAAVVTDCSVCHMQPHFVVCLYSHRAELFARTVNSLCQVHFSLFRAGLTLAQVTHLHLGLWAWGLSFAVTFFLHMKYTKNKDSSVHTHWDFYFKNARNLLQCWKCSFTCLTLVEF